MNVTISIPDWAKFILSDFTDMDRNPEAVSSPEWIVELPDDAYFEYTFLDAKGAMQLDPTNPVKADNPWYPNISAIIGPQYKADVYASPSVKAEGNLLRIRLESTHLRQTYRIIAYTPKGFENQALPVIYVQDGVAYYRIARLADVLEQLLQENKVRPAHLVFIEPNDRSTEYRFNPAYRAFILNELVAHIDQTLRTTSERVAMGASLGGLVSSVLALEHPDIFQSVISQSGAFLGSPTDLDFYDSSSSWVLDTLQQRDRLPIRWYTETGTIEWLTDINRKVRDVLGQKKYDYFYDERHAGHNWVHWRNGLGNALKFMLQ